jgi:hypothetical protein
MRRLLFLGEGTSDEGIAVHVERIADECGVPVVVTAPDLSRLRRQGWSVAAKLEAVRDMKGEYDLLLVHRDADRTSREDRVAEIRSAVEKVMPNRGWVPVIPIRMTEAWLLLDEQLLREVAGNPNGRVPLQIPAAREAERLADPKGLLKELLVTASELTGRKRQIFQNSFPHHRRLVLERICPNGGVRKLKSWQDFDRDLRQALAAFH